MWDFNSQLNTFGREPRTCDTPVSHSIDIPTKELIGDDGDFPSFDYNNEEEEQACCPNWQIHSSNDYAMLHLGNTLKSGVEVKARTLTRPAAAEVES